MRFNFIALGYGEPTERPPSYFSNGAHHTAHGPLPCFGLSTLQHPGLAAPRVWLTPREWYVWAITRSYLRDDWGLGVHPTQRVANTRYGAHTPFISPILALNPGAMLYFQCSSGGNTTDCGRTKA